VPLALHPPFLATRERPPSPDLVEANLSATTPPRVSSRDSHSLGGDRALVIKFNIRRARYPLAPTATLRRNSLFTFPTISITVSCSFYSDWISVRKHLIVNVKTLSTSSPSMKIYCAKTTKIPIFEHMNFIFGVFYLNNQYIHIIN